LPQLLRSMKSGCLEVFDGNRLVFMLGQIGKMIELHDIQKRIELLDVKMNLGNRLRKLESIGPFDPKDNICYVPLLDTYR
jgi:hypothetical protein